MSLFIRCSSCRKSFPIKNKAATRVYLAVDIGEYSKHRCTHCSVEKEYHVNDVIAKSNSVIQLLSFVLGLSIIFFLSKYDAGNGYVLSWSIAIGGAIITAGLYEGSAPSGFNSYRLLRSKKEKPTKRKGSMSLKMDGGKKIRRHQPKKNMLPYRK